MLPPVASLAWKAGERCVRRSKDWRKQMAGQLVAIRPLRISVRLYRYSYLNSGIAFSSSAVPLIMA